MYQPPNMSNSQPIPTRRVSQGPQPWRCELTADRPLLQDQAINSLYQISKIIRLYKNQSGLALDRAKVFLSMNG